mmetsp:Transcript_11045/g.18325  ORF Transcript_11045/g.18325 Transcript_11045/m.18325 type:complete len:89 (-) Transcript_11045:157-423(-)
MLPPREYRAHRTNSEDSYELNKKMSNLKMASSSPSETWVSTPPTTKIKAPLIIQVPSPPSLTAQATPSSQSSQPNKRRHRRSNVVFVG